MHLLCGAIHTTLIDGISGSLLVRSYELERGDKWTEPWD